MRVLVRLLKYRAGDVAEEHHLWLEDALNSSKTCCFAPDLFRHSSGHQKINVPLNWGLAKSQSCLRRAFSLAIAHQKLTWVRQLIQCCNICLYHTHLNSEVLTSPRRANLDAALPRLQQLAEPALWLPRSDHPVIAVLLRDPSPCPLVLSFPQP